MAILRWRPIGQAAERWDPFRDMGDLQHEMNRVFDTFFGRPAGPVTTDRVWAPAVDMYETKDEAVVSVDLPGVNEKDVSVTITGDVLTLKGERRQVNEMKQDDYYRIERWFGKFERSLPLSVPVEADKVKAAFRDGVLTIRLPKAEEVRPKQIKIDVL